MVEVGLGIGVPRGIEENPYSIALTPKFLIGEDVLSSASALRNYVAWVEIEFGKDFLLIDGSDSISVNDIDNLKKDALSLLDEPAWLDKASFIYDGGIKSVSAMRANGMSLTMPPTPTVGRSSANPREDLNLYLDSGAGRNVVFNPALLVNRRDPPAGTDQFMGADGSPMAVIGYGDIEMGNFRIPDVYLVQGLTVNLISVGQLASNHKVCCCFAGNECNLMMLSDGRRIGGAIRRDDNQYVLRFLEIE